MYTFIGIAKGNKERMHIFEMEKEDFKKLPKRDGFLKDIGEFYSLVIIP